MIPNVVRGGRMMGLMAYLVGEGRANEHTHPMVVAGDDRVTFQFEPGRELTAHDAFEIGYILDQPRRFHGTNVTVPVKERNDETGEFVKVGDKDAHVWHCSLSLREDERKVSADEWGKIAHSFMERMGFIDPDGAKSSRWVAIHHGASKNGNDHIHLAVQMVREDGTKADTNRDFRRAQTAARAIEKEHGLTVVAGNGVAGYKQAHAARAREAGDSLPVRPELRRRMRAALATADSPAAFLSALQDAGVRVAPSFEKGSATKIRGYKVALTGRAYRRGDGASVFESPSKLDASLSWPKVCARFGGRGQDEAEAMLRALHSSQRRPMGNVGHGRSSLRKPVHPVNVDRLMSGKRGTGPDTLANIFARLSLEMEGSKDGPLGRMSERMARAQSAPGSAAWRVRQSSRFAKGDGRGTLALVRQANRLSRQMASNHITQARPALANDMRALVSAVEKIHKVPDDATQTDVPTVQTPATERSAGHGRG